MVRVKRGANAHKKREKLLKHAKGFKWGRKSKERLAREALLHAWPHAYRGRKERKRNFRSLWQTQISAGAKINGLSYSKLIDTLHRKNIVLDRKILAQIAKIKPDVFTKIVEFAAS